MCGVVSVIPLAYRSKTIRPPLTTTVPSVLVSARKSSNESGQTPSAAIGMSPSSTQSIGHSCTSAGSFAISVDGTSSRTWWNAHRLNGARRQFANVT
jgi:hypothetical protein